MKFSCGDGELFGLWVSFTYAGSFPFCSEMKEIQITQFILFLRMFLIEFLWSAEDWDWVQLRNNAWTLLVRFWYVVWVAVQSLTSIYIDVVISASRTWTMKRHYDNQLLVISNTLHFCSQSLWVMPSLLPKEWELWDHFYWDHGSLDFEVCFVLIGGVFCFEKP